jgi:hypothetical protein
VGLRLGRPEATGTRGTGGCSANLGDVDVFVEVPVAEVVAEGGFRQRSAMCRIRGVGGRRWHEDVRR